MERLSAFLGDLFGDLWQPAKGLSLALFGVAVADLLVHGHWTGVVLLVVSAILIATIMDACGRFLLPWYPRAGLAFLELWIVAPASLAALASGLVILVALALAVPEGTAPFEKEAMGTVASALTAFLTTGFISFAGDSGTSRMAARIQRIFYGKYGRAESWPPPQDGRMHFIASSRAENLVYSNAYSGIEGWGLKARWERARRLEEEIERGTSTPQAADDIVMP
ncbi:hypothetical protein L0F51_18265 [Afifella sp. H1R]|uniref:hypothetical protein n=1 Tax=Afifella sp. H1R TaxID=2908841 RepID=UPI001F237B5E|nr:hypothetical protein [Afifella sp. H1R]MCF1505703.1 hypothetical protein [Afifella sp. H1R]